MGRADTRRHGRGVRARARVTAVILAGLALVIGCAPAKVRTSASPQIDQYRVKTVALMPLTSLVTPQAKDREPMIPVTPAGVERSNIQIATPPAGERAPAATKAVPDFAPDKITEMFYGRLKFWEGITILPPDEGRRTLAMLQLSATAPPSELARELARAMSVDAVLLGRVDIYREREGGKFGADSAAVGFEVRLVAADGKTLWVGNYYEKQKPMIEDFSGFIERKGVFVTAEELARYGVEHVLEEFPFGAPPR